MKYEVCKSLLAFSLIIFVGVSFSWLVLLGSDLFKFINLSEDLLLTYLQKGKVLIA